VLRRKPPGKLLPSAHAVDREFRVIQALTAKRFPVAQPVLYCADESLTGTPFYVMGFVGGRVFWNPEMPGSNPRERASIYDVMVATLARLHCYDPAGLGLSDFGRGENYVARQVNRWSKQYRASQTQPIDEMERLIEWLPAHIPPSGPVRLVHGDYRLDNMIFDTSSTRVLAVLDWELSTLGDPLADFTYHLMSWVMPSSDPQRPSIALVVDKPGYGIPNKEQYVARYCELTGRKGLADLDYYFAYNAFRLAGIIQGIVGRVRDGTASNAAAAQNEGRVEPLAKFAYACAQRAGLQG
jgi:aminoglycoside phosphotransferase (APT) family kinase protein